MKSFYSRFLFFSGILMSSLFTFGQGHDETPYTEPVWVSEAPRDSFYIDSLLREGTSIGRTHPAVALNYYNAALDLSKTLKLPTKQARSLRSTGLIYANLGLYSQSIEIYTQELELRSEMNNLRQTGWTYNNLGNNYSNIEAYDLAKDCFQKAYNLFKQAEDPIKATFPLVNLAALYRDMGEYQKALVQYQEILAVNEGGEKVPKRDAAVFNNIGFTHETMGNEEEALKYYELALAEKYDEKSNYSAINTLDNLTSVHIKLGNFEKAQMYLDSTRRMIARYNGTEYLAPSLLNGALLRSGQGRYKAAFQELKEHLELKDSISSGDQKAKVNNIMMVMNQVEEDVQLRLLQKDNELMNSSTRQKNLIIVGLAVLLLLLLGLIVARWRFTQKLRKANERLELKRDEISAQKDEIDRQKKSLEAQNEVLEQAIQEKDGLIGFVAHDLKAPVNKTIGLLNMLESIEADENQARQVVNLLTKVNRNALELINDLLLISETENAGEPADLEFTSLSNLLTTATGEFSTMAERKNIRLNLAMDQDVNVRTHAKSVSRILDNFISNALKYSPQDSRVEVGLEKSEMGCRIFVRDEGPGISEADQEKMFRKFQKLTARPTGGESSHGLGLAIAKSLADRIGARIDCQSEKGKGATFFLTFNAA